MVKKDGFVVEEVALDGAGAGFGEDFNVARLVVRLADATGMDEASAVGVMGGRGEV